MSLQTDVQHVKPDTAVIVFSGNLTLGMALSAVDRQMQSMVASGICRMVCDLTEVSYVDSAGLGVLVHTAGLARQKNGMVRLCGVSERVSTLLKLTMMDTVLPVEETSAASLAALA